MRVYAWHPQTEKFHRRGACLNLGAACDYFVGTGYQWWSRLHVPAGRYQLRWRLRLRDDGYNTLALLLDSA